MAKPLPADIDVEVARLYDEGDRLLDEDEEQEALAQYQAAWDLIPEPKAEWQRALQVLCGIADCHYFLLNFEACRQQMQLALRSGGEPGNPYICLRLGQCYLELGNEHEAGHWLTCALLTGGVRIFENAEPKYWAFLKERLHPPPGGWPEGW